MAKKKRGILELHPNGYGFLRSPEKNYSRERSDPFVPGTMIERFGLRQGVKLRAMVQQARRQQGPRVREFLDVDGMAPEDYLDVKAFDDPDADQPRSVAAAWRSAQARLPIA
jgi:transcription termination factor Rho